MLLRWFTAAVVLGGSTAFTPTLRNAVTRGAGQRRVAVSMASATTARSEGLALALDDGTRKSHSVAENTAFVTGFFRGMSNEKSFSRLVCALYYIYEAMESSLDNTENAEAKALDYPELRRLPFLEKDMVSGPSKLGRF